MFSLFKLWWRQPCCCSVPTLPFFVFPLQWVLTDYQAREWIWGTFWDIMDTADKHQDHQEHNYTLNRSRLSWLWAKRIACWPQSTKQQVWMAAFFSVAIWEKKQVHGLFDLILDCTFFLAPALVQVVLGCVWIGHGQSRTVMLSRTRHLGYLGKNQGKLTQGSTRCCQML